MDQHYLIVHEEPDDGMDIEHPPSCPTKTIYDGMVLIHTCTVEQIVGDWGLDLFFHREGEEPHPHAYGDSEQVSPGRWPIESWEHDSGLRLAGGASDAS